MNFIRSLVPVHQNFLVVKVSSLTFLASTLKDRKKETKTLPCTKNLGQAPRNLGDHRKIQVIRKTHTL